MCNINAKFISDLQIVDLSDLRGFEAPNVSSLVREASSRLRSEAPRTPKRAHVCEK